jgi:hypothetical protein
MVCILVHNLELTRMANLRSLDLNLLTVFEAVYDTKNITEAAQRLGVDPVGSKPRATPAPGSVAR